jgi:hypothetical protein
MPVLDDLHNKAKQFDLVLEKVSQRMLTPDKVREQLQHIRNAAGRNQSRKFRGVLEKNLPDPIATTQSGQPVYVYHAKLRLKKEGETTKEKLLQQYEEVMRVVKAAARTKGWVVLDEGQEGIALRTGELNPLIVQAERERAINVQQNLNVELPSLTRENMIAFFGRLYRRENHIRIIHAANLTAAMTRFEKRRHCLAWGPPGTAKTQMFDAFVQLYGPDKVLHLDATTTTKAGLENLILRKASDGLLPPFLYLEEIEKYDLNMLHCLHAIMDERGRIQRTNARIGNVAAEAKMVVWATCNSLGKLKQFEGGAILSRFSNRKQLYCPRPDEDLMRLILAREVEEMGGDEFWVEPVVRFVFDEMKTNDPREAVSLLDGRELLLGDAPYLQWTRENLEAERKDKALEKEFSLTEGGIS